MFLMNLQRSFFILELPANRFLAPCFLGPVLFTTCETVLLKDYNNVAVLDL